MCVCVTGSRTSGHCVSQARGTMHDGDVACARSTRTRSKQAAAACMYLYQLHVQLVRANTVQSKKVLPACVHQWRVCRCYILQLRAPMVGYLDDIYPTLDSYGGQRRSSRPSIHPANTNSSLKKVCNLIHDASCMCHIG